MITVGCGPETIPVGSASAGLAAEATRSAAAVRRTSELDPGVAESVLRIET